MRKVQTSSDTNTLIQENCALRRQLKSKENLLKEKNEELQRYLYTVAHELKTPIVSIRGYAMILQDYYLGTLNQDIRNYLERMVTNLDQMEDLIKNLLDYTRIDVSLEECEPVDMTELFGEALDELDFVYQPDQYEIIVSPNLPTVFCKRSLMLRVLTNLLSNAMKYSRDTQQPRIEFGYVAGEIFHKFYLKDNGIGIAHQDLDKIFQIFGRLDNKKNTKGTGLGLVISRRIIEKHGGEMWVESVKGRGSTFYFTLPREQEIRLAKGSDKDV
ncbi:MAG: HAMP domain-containing histidine kinase [candidate division KSB1 bacterium]|nr:HAMP domain-containing histidine kinase [candidate division KSB1 bacterium]